MCRALALLLLAAEGALAQSWEPSKWDANVSAYGGTVETDPDLAGCPCNPKKHVCSNQTISPTETEQTKANELKVTWASKPALKFAYLTDEYGTIISYNADTGTGNEVTFTWDMSQQPTGLVPHLVYAGSCADVVPRIIVLKICEIISFPQAFLVMGKHPSERICIFGARQHCGLKCPPCPPVQHRCPHARGY